MAQIFKNVNLLTLDSLAEIEAKFEGTRQEIIAAASASGPYSIFRTFSEAKSAVAAGDIPDKKWILVSFDETQTPADRPWVYQVVDGSIDKTSAQARNSAKTILFDNGDPITETEIQSSTFAMCSNSDFRKAGVTVSRAGFFAEGDSFALRSPETRGFNSFVYDPNCPRSQADGGYVIDPTSIGSLSETSLGDYYTHQGTGTGNGCFVSLTAQSVVSPAQFGVVFDDAATDNSKPLLQCIKASSALGTHITWIGDIHVFTDVECADYTVSMICANRSTSRIILHNGACFDQSSGKRDNSVYPKPMTLIGVGFEDFANYGSSANGVNPLVRRGPGSELYVDRCAFLGWDNRRYGAWFGYGRTCYGSCIKSSHFFACLVGVVTGDSADSTHLVFINNTVDHNKVCGAIHCQPRGGIYSGNSYEHNEGKTAVAVLSQSGTQATDFALDNNYIFDNCGNHSGQSDAIAVKIGLDVPDTDFDGDGKNDFTSSAPAVDFSYDHNYTVSDSQYMAFAMLVDRGFSVCGNTLLNSNQNNVDGKLAGALAQGNVYGNENQNTAAFNAIETDSGQVLPQALKANANGDVAITGHWLSGKGTKYYAPNTPFDGRAGHDYLGTAGQGGQWTDIVDLSNIYGVVQILANIEQNNQNQQSRHVLMCSDLDEDKTYACQYQAPSSAPDNRTFRKSGYKIQIKSDNGWQGDFLISYAGSPY